MLTEVLQPCACCSSAASHNLSDLCDSCRSAGARSCDLCDQFAFGVMTVSVDGKHVDACGDCIKATSCDNCGEMTAHLATVSDEQPDGTYSEMRCPECRGERAAA